MAKTSGGVRTAGQQAPTMAGVVPRTRMTKPVNRMTQRSDEEDALAEWMGNNNIAGPYWNTREAQTDFEFESFLAPEAFVRRRSDNVRGSLEWADAQAIPELKKKGIYARLYFGFIPR